MKRIQIVLAFTLVFIAHVVSAQQPAIDTQDPVAKMSPLERIVSVDLLSADIVESIQKLCAGQRANCSIAPEVKGVWTGSISEVSLLRAIQTIAGSRNYVTTVEDGIVYVKAESASATSTRPHSPSSDSTAEYVNKVLRGAYGDRYVDELAADNARRTQQAGGQTSLNARPNGQPALLPTCQPLGYTQAQSPQARPTGSEAPYAYNMGYVGNTWNGLPYFYDLAHKDQSRRLDNEWSTALVKFKGRKRGRDEEFLEKVSVVALVHDTQGCPQQYVIIDAAEGNNWYDRDVKVPISADQSVTLLFVMEDGSDNPPAFGRRLWLQPRAVEKHATPIIVQEKKLQTARDHYNLKTHVFEEGADGQIVHK